MEKTKTKLIGIKRRNRQAGLTALEYAAGATVVATIIYTAFNAMGGHMSNLMNSVGSWAERRAGNINSNG